MDGVGSDSESGSGGSTYEPDDAMTYVRAAIPAIEAYYADNNTYSGLTLTALKGYDAGIKNILVIRATPASYCVQSTVGQAVYKKAGPSADITVSAC